MPSMERANGAEVTLRVFAYSFRYNPSAVLIYAEHRAGPAKSQTLEATVVAQNKGGALM